MLYAQQHSAVSCPSSAASTRGAVRQISSLLVLPMQYEPLLDDLPPEVFGDVAVAVLAGQLVASSRADDLRDLRVDVQALQLVPVLGERIEERRLREPVAELEILFLAGGGREVVEHLVHSAVLDLEHALPVRIREAGRAPPHPARHPSATPSASVFFVWR